MNKSIQINKEGLMLMDKNQKSKLSVKTQGEER